MKFIRNIIIFLFLAFLTICFAEAPLLKAQPQMDKAKSLIARGDTLLSEGKLSAAQRAYKKALKLNKNAFSAHAGLGKVDMARGKWGNAGKHFGKVLRQDPQNFAAHYYRAICYRETGKTKALIFRKIDWDKSKKHFQWIINRNKNFKEILYQFALLKRYRDKYPEAIDLAQEQIQLRPDLPEARAGLYRIYRSYIRNKNAKQVEAWLSEQPWQQARFALGELWRRKGRLQEADSLLQALLQKKLEMRPQPIFLALARIHYAKNQPEIGQRYFWLAVDTMEEPGDATLVFEDLKYIISDEELKQYHALTSISQKKTFFHAFWARRDPTPATLVNVRLQEHYQRLMYAEKNYEYDGFRTWFNSPDKLGYLHFPQAYQLNSEFNDMGLIYIRHGPPDEWEATVKEGIATNDSWHYYKTEDTPELIFHFVIDANATGKNWRITPIMTDRDWLADRAGWGSVYFRLLNAEPTEVMALETEMAEESDRAVKIGFATDRHTWPDSIKPLQLAYSVAAFRGTRDSAMVEVYYGVPTFQIAKIRPHTEKVIVEQGIAVQDSTWQLVMKKIRRSVLRLAQKSYKKGDYFIESFRFPLAPNVYQFSINAKPIGTPLLGGYQFDKKIPDYFTPDLAVSDLQLAFQIVPAPPGKTKFVKNGLQVVVNPTHQFKRKQPVYAYFEVYNLQKDGEGKTKFKIDYTVTLLKRKKSVFKRVFGFLGGGGKSSISLSTDRQGNRESSIEYVQLNISKLKPGEYQLTVKVTDQINGQSQESAVELTIAP